MSRETRTAAGVLAGTLSTAAPRRALTECDKNAPDCMVALWFNDQCGAVASAKDGI